MDDGRLHGKYFIERADGQHRPDARYFVLNYATDPYARVALAAYADACEGTHPALASDLRAVCALHEERDRRRRRSPDKPLRGTQGSGADPANAAEFLELIRRRADSDPEFAAMLQELSPASDATADGRTD